MLFEFVKFLTRETNGVAALGHNSHNIHFISEFCFPFSWGVLNEELFVAAGAHVLVCGRTRPGCFSIIRLAASNHTT